MEAKNGPTPAKRLDGGKTAKGMAVDPAIAGLEKTGGITKETAMLMLMRGQRAQLEAIGRGASKALFEIMTDTSVEKFERKNAADMLLWTVEGEMPPEEVAMCLLIIGFPREREIAKIGSSKVDVVLKNVLLDEKEEQEMRARAALALRERGFGGFERPDDNACYMFFGNRYSELPGYGLAAVPFLLGRLRDDLSLDNRINAARLLGEISDICDEPYDWRGIVGLLREIAENEDERRVHRELRLAATHAFKRITGVYPSQDRSPSATGPAGD